MQGLRWEGEIQEWKTFTIGILSLALALLSKDLLGPLVSPLPLHIVTSFAICHTYLDMYTHTRHSMHERTRYGWWL